jgi:serine/threonine-protein kinase PpkA
LNGAPKKLTDEGSAFAAAGADITIPGYHIKRQLGRGGMASVYLATQESFGRDVAFKVLAPHHGVDSEFSQRFLREARIISQLVHPNIVTVYDVGVYEGLHYLSMEYIRGRDLQEACGSLSKRQVINIIRDVAKALEYAHQQGYIHRDVKPENIMLHEDGRVVLMDFGIARGSDTTLGMTKTGRAIGTPYYMSPEQTKGQPVDHRTDIYSLGVVLYQMLTGYVPYDADSAIAVGIKHVSAPIPQLPDSLRFLQPIINTCLSKDPAHRFQTAGELIHVLEAIPDNMLAAAEAKAEAFRNAGRDHSTETLISSEALNDDAIPQIRIPTDERKTVSATRIPPVKTKPPRRRRGLLFLLLLLTLGGVGYLKQGQLVELWYTQIHPYLVQYNILKAPAVATVNEPAEAVTPPASVNGAAITDSTQDSITTLEPATTAETGTATAITTPQERIEQLRAELDSQPKQAVELAMLYRQLIRQEPDNPSPQQSMAELRAWYTDGIRDAFAVEDLQRARLLVDQLKTSFPQIGNSEIFQRLEQKLIQAKAVQSHLQQAQVYVAANALIQPEEANALAELRAALALAPDNVDIQQAIQQIADTFLFKAKEHRAKGELEQALTITTEGLTVIADDPALLALQQQLLADKERQQYVARQLGQAEKQFLAGMLITPGGKSAYDHYHAILKRDPGNTTAKKGLKTIEQQLVNQAIKNIEAENFDAAKAELDKASQYFSKTKAIRAAELKLSMAIEETRPKIQRIVFSEIQLSSLATPQTDKLQLSRTLYIGFDYQNFETETTLLQAVLMDGTGRVQIAQKPVIISGAAGEHYFYIDLPVEGFADGSYTLQLKLDDQQLIAGSFLVNKPAQP